MGYTPAFDDIYMGTLYGRWPAAAVWASLLPLLDKNGVIDMSPQAIAGMTGWPMDLLEEGIRQLMEPDPHSRSADSEGRRLVLIEEGRPWGWRAVNHGKYREKARLQSKNAREVESGKNRDRMADRPPVTAGDRRSPPPTPSQTHTQTKTEEKRDRSPGGDRFPEFWEIYPRKVGKPKAEQAWKKAIRSVPAEKIIEHLRARVGTDKQWLEGKQFIPHPTTWLNRAGWDDEYEAVKAKQDFDDGVYV